MTFDAKFKAPFEFKHEMELVVDPQSVDVYGHVNNAAYLQLFEVGRWEFYRTRGATRTTLDELGLGPVVLEAHVKFRKELKAGDKIKMKLYVGKKAKIFDLMQTMTSSEEGVLACEALYRMSFFDLKRRKIVDKAPFWENITWGSL